MITIRADEVRRGDMFGGIRGFEVTEVVVNDDSTVTIYFEDQAPFRLECDFSVTVLR